MNVCFDEFAVGDRFVSRSRTVTEADLVMFSGLSGDHSRLHTDAEWASSSAFGRRVAHGLLTLSIASGLEYALLVSDEDHFLAFYGMDRVRFVRPVFIGDTIRIEFEVKALDQKGPDAGVVTFAAEIRNQRGEVVVVFEKRVLVEVRPSIQGLDRPPAE
jgi:3-hydroxybutyryl-CoA dehydratase